MAGTAQPSRLGFLGYDEEGAFAEALTTYDKTLQIRDESLDVSSLNQEMIDRGGVFDRPHDGDLHVPGPFSGANFSFTMDLYGHGTTTAGALTETPLARLLGHIHGNSDATDIGGALTAGTLDANTITSTNTTLVAGSLIRVGALNDARAEGQGSVAQDATSSYELVVSLPGSPIAGDNVYATQQIYPTDSITNAHLTSAAAAANSTTRFIVATGNQQYALRGCACTSFAINGLNPGEMPTVTMGWQAAHWSDISVTFPTVTATTDKAPPICVNGSLHIQTVGTTTRNVERVRNFSATFNHTMTPLIAQGGINSSQTIQGWVRGRSTATITFDVEAQAATASPTFSALWNTDPNTQVYKGILYTASVVDGRTMMLWFPRCRIMGNRPTQVTIDGLAHVRVMFEAVEASGWSMSTDNNLTRAPWVIGLG